jgi:hypothetical protein
MVLTYLLFLFQSFLSPFRRLCALVEDGRAKVAEEEAQVEELQERPRAGNERLARTPCIGGGASGMARDNRWRENPDIPAKEEEEEEALEMLAKP